MAAAFAELHAPLCGVDADLLEIVESDTYQDIATGREHLLAAVSHELRTP